MTRKGNYVVSVKGNELEFRKFGKALGYFDSVAGKNHNPITYQLLRSIDILIVGDVSIFFRRFEV